MRPQDLSQAGEGMTCVMGTRPSVMRLPRAALLIAVAFCFIPFARGAAQSDTVTRRDSSVRAVATARDSTTHRLALDGSRLRAGRWLYSLTLRPDSTLQVAANARASETPVRADIAVRPNTGIQPDTVARSDSAVRYLGVIEHALAEGTHGGLSSWIFTTQGVRAGVTVAESLWVDRADMHPQHWASVAGPSRLSAEFTRDSLYAAVNTPAGRKSIVAGARSDLLVNEAMTDAALSVLPIVPGYADSVAVLVVDIGACASAPARLTTEGEERVIVPAGSFDAIVVSLEAERGAARYWIDKVTHMVLRSEQSLPELGGAILRRELLRAN